MKVLNNVLLAAALASSTALANDIDNHSKSFDVLSTDISVQLTESATASFKAGSPLEPWEIMEKQALINDGEIIEGGYEEIRADRYMLMQLSPDKLASELLGVLDDNVSVSFRVGYFAAEFFNQLETEHLLETQKYMLDVLMDKDMPSNWVEHDNAYIIESVEATITSHRKTSIPHYFDKLGLDEHRNYHMKKATGIDFSQSFSDESGMVDHFTKSPVTIGEVYLNGCICAAPDAGNDYLVVESYMAPNTNQSLEIAKVLDSSEMSLTKQRKGESVKDGSSFFMLVDDSPQQKGYMYLNKTHGTLSKEMKANNEVPYLSDQEIDKFMLSFVMHHEFKHAHDFLSDKKKGYHQDILVETFERKRDGMSDGHELGKVTEYEYATQKLHLKLEMQADAFGLAKTLQQWVGSQEGPVENHLHKVDSLLKSFSRSNSLRDIKTQNRLAVLDTLEAGLFEGKDIIFESNNEKREFDTLADFLKATPDDEDVKYYIKKYIDEERKNSRHLYHSAGTSIELSSLVNHDIKAFMAMDDKELLYLNINSFAKKILYLVPYLGGRIVSY